MSNKGSGFIIVLAIVSLLAVLAVNFTYTIQVNTTMLSNYRNSQRAYSMCKSGIWAATSLLLDEIREQDYVYLNEKRFYIKNPYRKDTADIIVDIEDESGKFNINNIISPSGNTNEPALESFRRLLEYIEIKIEVADIIADWIDADKEERRSKTETKAKNRPLESIDEIILIPGIEKNVFEKLQSYVTIYGDSLININSADIPVLMSLRGEMTEDLAQRIISFRKNTPFTHTSDIMKVAGFETIGISLMGRITVKGNCFLLKAYADSQRVKKKIHSIIEIRDDETVIKHWREM